VTEFNYRISTAEEAHIFVGLQVASPAERGKIKAALAKHKFPALDLTDDEMAKLHLRHLVGGRSALAKDELIFRFEFPERPRALMNFLSSMSPTWNITLFHYRNHGADYGRILVGMQVPKQERKELEKFLKTLGYSYTDETSNPAYKLFLS
jgi:threonine dehydratase